jgi:hypothetical protein
MSCAGAKEEEPNDLDERALGCATTGECGVGDPDLLDDPAADLEHSGGGAVAGRVRFMTIMFRGLPLNTGATPRCPVSSIERACCPLVRQTDASPSLRKRITWAIGRNPQDSEPKCVPVDT